MTPCERDRALSARLEELRLRVETQATRLEELRHRGVELSAHTKAVVGLGRQRRLLARSRSSEPRPSDGEPG